MSERDVAIITGAASGIGLATARRLAQAGYLVVTCDLNPAPLPLPENWSAHLLGDVCRMGDLRHLVANAKALGKITCLVNNAGIGMVKEVEEVTETDWDRCLDINLKAAFFASQLVLPEMRRAGGGSIINVASNAGLLPRAHDPVYSISKQALVGLTRSLALCFSRDRVRVNAVCPGPVCDTGMINADLDRAPDREEAEQMFINASPLASAFGRMITPAEVAESIAYLASPAACLVTGTAIAIDGGKSLGVPPR